MQKSSQLSYTLLIAAIAVLAGSLVTVAVISLQEPVAPATIKPVPPVLSIPSPAKPTDDVPTTRPATPVISGTPVSTYVQELTVKDYAGRLPTDPATLEDYRWILEQSISDYWMKTYTSTRAGSPGILDLDLAHWTQKLPQASIPASLASWPKITVTPWTTQSFSATFSKAEGSSWMNFGNSITFRYIDGDVASLDKKNDAAWTAVACPSSTAEDIAAMANIFALAYPPAINDKELCSHITSVAIPSKDHKDIKAYTLNTAFAPVDYSDGWGGGEGSVYRPTFIMKSAKKEDMIGALKLNHFFVIETSLRTVGQDKVSVLAPTADLMISLMDDLNVDGWCGYESCY